MGTDLGLSLSASGSATSGLEGNLSRLTGDVFTGGSKPPNKWILPAIIAGVFTLAVVWILHR